MLANYSHFTLLFIKIEYLQLCSVLLGWLRLVLLLFLGTFLIVGLSLRGIPCLLRHICFLLQRLQ